MINTFNRRPLSVNTPDGKDVEHKYLNQYDWKGLIDNKNFLSVDQNSFADCNNVYVDEQGLLKSRPSLKVKSIIVKLDNGEHILADIIDVYTFDNIVIYKSYIIQNNEKLYILTFVKENENVHIQYNLTSGDINFENVNLIMMDGKIFIFSEYKFDYYDMIENKIYSADDNIYIPITKAIVNGIESDDIRTESKNILTEKEYISYKFNDIFNQDFTTFINKDVIVKIGTETYNINFKESNELVFVDKLTSLTSYEIANEIALGYNCEGIPLLDIAENGVILMTTVNYGTNYNTPTSYRLRYSVDGLTFTNLPILEGAKGIGKITKDGLYAIHYRIDGPYIISLLNDKYPIWKNLLQLQNNYSSFAKETSYFNTSLDNYHFTVASQLNGYYIDDQNFSFTYTKNTFPKNSSPDYPNEGTCMLVTCLNGILNTETIYDSVAVRTFTGTTSGDTTTFGNNTITYKRVGGVIDNDGVINIGNLTITNLEYSEPSTMIGSTVKSRLKCSVSINVNYSSTLNNKTEYSNYKCQNYKVNLSSDKDFGNIYTTEIFYETSVEDIPYLKFRVYQVSSVTYVDIMYGEIVIYDPIYPGTDSVIFTSGDKPLTCVIDNKNIHAYGKTYNVTPNVKMIVDNSTGTLTYKTVVSFQTFIGSRDLMYYGVYLSNGRYNNIIDYKLSDVIIKYDGEWYKDISLIRPPLRDDVNIINNEIYLATVIKDENNLCTNVITYLVDEYTVRKTEVNVETELNYDKGLSHKTLRLSYDENYLITNNKIFINSTYGEYDTFKSINLLVDNVEPVLMYYADNEVDSLYYVKNNMLYSSKAIADDNFVTINVLSNDKNNYLTFDYITKLSNFYFSKGKTLYISKNIYEDDKFKWYLPNINKEEFDYNITNLHPISSTEVAIFLNNSVYYTVYDTNVSAYRYYKTKIQVGCKKGCDVITTFDGKYVIFPSERGLVAMSYQQFVATTEQSLDYLSDNIYSIFYNYLTESGSKNEIKLYKHSYWIFVYKQDSKKGFLLDMRNLSWWPIEGMYNTSKFVEMNNKTVLLSNNKLFSLNTSDAYYFDNDGKLKARIKWFVKSQKLHLNALNYYKHIVNITFASVHDVEALKQSQHNVQNTNLKLQVNNYRKKIDGNIDSKDDWSVVHYNIDIVRTYIQRLNYSKVNEFQYMLSYDNQTALNVPLSLSNITIKYKIGGQIR